MLRFGDPLSFGHDTPDQIALVNFSPPEDGFVWSDGRWAEITFDIDFRDEPRSEAAIRLRLDLDVFKFPPVLNGQHVLIYCNGVRVKSAFVTDRTALQFPLGVAPLLRQQNVLTFDLPDVRMPQDLGVSDERMLGMQLFSLSLDATA